MGKGDRKTTKGKRFSSSYGNVRRRRRPALRVGATPDAPVAKKATAAKTAPRKVVVKKAAAKA